MISMRWTFTPDSSPEQQLLAISIELLELLRQHAEMTLFVPTHVHKALSQNHYGLLLFDTLAAEHMDLESRLHLRVHSVDYFEVEISP